MLRQACPAPDTALWRRVGISPPSFIPKNHPIGGLPPADLPVIAEHDPAALKAEMAFNSSLGQGRALINRPKQYQRISAETQERHKKSAIRTQNLREINQNGRNTLFQNNCFKIFVSGPKGSAHGCHSTASKEGHRMYLKRLPLDPTNVSWAIDDSQPNKCCSGKTHTFFPKALTALHSVLGK